jgi:hypothetical protein
MTINVPLAVRVGTVHLTKQLHEVTFRREAIGGVREISLRVPIRADRVRSTFPLLSEVAVMDTRSGRTVADGRLGDVAITMDPLDGETVELTVWGPATHAGDVARGYILKDAYASGWDIGSANTTNKCDVFAIEASDDDGESRGWKYKFDPGETITTSDEGHCEYKQLDYVDMEFARCYFQYSMGITDSNYDLVIDGRTGAGQAWGTNYLTIDALNGSSSQWANLGDEFTAQDITQIRLFFARSTSSITGATTHWCKVTNPIVFSIRYDKTGTKLTAVGDYADNNLYPYDVIKDMLGRPGMLPDFDGANATIVEVSDQLEQLAYYDPVTPEQVLEDLMTLVPSFRWYTRPRRHIGGKYQFEWDYWPSSVRYLANVDDGASFPYSITNLYNKVAVSWVDKKGRSRVVIRTAAVPLLDDLGLTRQANIELGKDVGSASNAATAGDNFLTEHAVPTNTGTLNIARPIFDLAWGRYVEPFEIEAGELISVRGYEGNPHKALNATASDGTTTFRIWAVDYTGSTNTARLELDLGGKDIASGLARLKKRRTRKAS